MLPPPEILAHMKSKEEPAAYPSGPNTSFHNLTPMPHRFTEEALPAVNVRHEDAKDEHPCYTTTSGEIGRLPMEGSDLPMRWYGRSAIFTSGWVAEPKTKVNSGLNTGMDRSDIHQKCAATLNPWAATLVAHSLRPNCVPLTPSRRRHGRCSPRRSYDQGWAGKLGVYDYNIANMASSKFVGKAPRGPDS